MSQSNSSATLDDLRGLINSHAFVERLAGLSDQAAAGDETAFQVLSTMLGECSDAGTWQRNARWCSAAAHAMARVGTPTSLVVFSEHVRGMGTASYGIVELLSTLLAGYGASAGPKAFLLARMAPASASRAIGIQTLCQLALEHQLEDDEEDELRRLLLAFEADSFLTQDLVDQTKTQLRSRMDQDDAAAVADDLDDILVFTDD